MDNEIYTMTAAEAEAFRKTGTPLPKLKPKLLPKKKRKPHERPYGQRLQDGMDYFTGGWVADAEAN